MNCNAQQSIDSSLPNFVMPSDWHGRIVDATFLVRHVAHSVRLIGWNEHDADRLIYCVADENGKVFWAGEIKFIDHETETETETETTIETETMNCNADGPLRMYDANGSLITPANVGFYQLDELGEFLAELWPNVAVIRCRDTYAVAYGDDGVRFDSFNYDGLPEHLQDAVRELNLDCVELEFIEFA